MNEIKVEKDQEFDLESEIKVENEEIQTGDMIFVKEEPIEENHSVPENTGNNSSFEDIVFVQNDQGESENPLDFHSNSEIKTEEQGKLTFENTFEEDNLPLTENFKESNRENECDDQCDLVSEIKVEETKIQVSELTVKQIDQRTVCVICKASLTHQAEPSGATCVSCKKPVCSECENRKKGLSGADFFICTLCQSALYSDAINNIQNITE
ncbi:hypothetical protein DMENIID0001_084610 [Sergentomyia squamirostris]